MLYHIKWNPTPEMSGRGFCVALWPDWKRLVSISDLDGERMDYVLRESLGPSWLKDHSFDPDLYRGSLRVSWGEWGPEHISVPGSACGLDIDRGAYGFAPRDGVALTPHNVDSLEQASLLLTIFSFVADFLVNEDVMRQMDAERSTPDAVRTSY